MNYEDMTNEEIKKQLEWSDTHEFSYGYSMWAFDEIERLKQGYCELKEKCNKGECDCTHEEYNGMCEENIKMDLEIERLNNDIKELRELLEHKNDKIERLHSIIKAVREYIEKNTNEIKSTFYGIPDYKEFVGYTEDILEILDKADINV